MPVFDFFEKTLGYPAQDTYQVYNPEYTTKLGELFTDDNIDLIKSYIIVHGAIDMAENLDRECYEWKVLADNAIYGITDMPDDSKTFSTYVNMNLPWATARLYSDTYISAEAKE